MTHEESACLLGLEGFIHVRKSAAFLPHLAEKGAGSEQSESHGDGEPRVTSEVPSLRLFTLPYLSIFILDSVVTEFPQALYCRFLYIDHHFIMLLLTFTPII